LDSNGSAHVCPDLAWSELLPSSSNHQHNVNFSTVLYYDLDDNIDSVIESSINFISDDQPTCSASIDPTSKYLYALDLHLSEMKSDCTRFYANSLHGNEQSLQAHMDAGSMSSTTNWSNYLWDLNPSVALLLPSMLLMIHLIIPLELAS